MKRAITDFGTRAVTRRTVLCGALASAVASIVPSRVPAEIGNSSSFGSGGDVYDFSASRANLYAFPGLQPGTTVIAATWSDRLNRFEQGAQEESQVTIHASKWKWDVKLPGGAIDAAFLEQQRCRVFAGGVATQPGTDGVALKAVVIEIPDKVLSSSGQLDIWAERRMHSGLRRRVGSPFVAALIAEDAGLANSYHSISPSDDRALLTEDVVMAIAAKVRRSGMAGDPDAYARRLASRLLPDVLHYDLRWPSGFTFAAQNGRHPEEASNLIVDTILSGSPASGSPKAGVRLQMPFPFFSRHQYVA